MRTECLADALDNHVEFGVWGGMTERERRALLPPAARVVAVVGSAHGANMLWLGRQPLLPKTEA